MFQVKCFVVISLSASVKRGEYLLDTITINDDVIFIIATRYHIHAHNFLGVLNLLMSPIKYFASLFSRSSVHRNFVDRCPFVTPYNAEKPAKIHQ